MVKMVFYFGLWSTIVWGVIFVMQNQQALYIFRNNNDEYDKAYWLTKYFPTWFDIFVGIPT